MQIGALRRLAPWINKQELFMPGGSTPVKEGPKGGTTRSTGKKPKKSK